VAAGRVYAVFAKNGFETGTQPQPDHALLGGFIGYHMRTVNHDLNLRINRA